MTTVSLEVSDGIAVITLDGADSRNALDGAAARALVDACDRIEADASIGAAIVRGANGTFCSGGARGVLARAGEDPAESERYDEIGLIYAAFHRFGTLGVPTIAAAAGAAVGAGTNLLLAADVAIVADDLRLIGGFARAGIHPGGGHFTLVDRLAGRGAAAAIGLFDEEVSGERAVTLGLAWASAPADEVDERALTLARRVAGDPVLARRVVRTLHEELGPPGVPWATAIAIERAPQMWSLRRRSTGA
jgi:enoyl-CoA hydratase